MSFYPAEIVSVNDDRVLVRIEATGKEIAFHHNAHNSIPPETRLPGTRGFISFPKAPPVFTVAAAQQAAA